MDHGQANGGNEQTKEDVDGFRSTLAQVIAAGSISWLCTGVGFIVAMPTIVIGALRNEALDSPMALSETEASWFGSLMFVIEPVSSMVAAFCQDMFGRKTCLWLCNVPLFAAWIIIYFATSTAHLFVAIFMMGISIGFIETPYLAYVGEISQPRLRGVLSSLGGMFYNSGLMFQSFLGAVLPWRTMVLCSLIMPVTGFIYMFLVPESPAWLMTKGRVRDAEKSFQWLRGCVTPEAVRKELDELINYVKKTQGVEPLTSSDYIPVSTTEEDVAAPKAKTMMGAMTEFEVLTAFRIVFLYFIISNMAGLNAMKPFLIEILVFFKSPIRPNNVVAVCGFLQMAGASSVGLGMKAFGKRGLTFISLSTCILSCFGLAIYDHWQLEIPWLPVILFFITYLFGTLGIINISWILIVELFPLRVRGLAGGVCNAFGNVILFLVTKTYYDVVRCLSMAGACFLYGVVGLLGLGYLYWDLPETEGLSLLDIERRLAERRSRRDVPPAPADVQL